MANRFEPPADWTVIRTIDAHTAGEPLRVVTSGWPDIPGATVLEKRRHAREHHESLRRALMWEPRGHADMYGCVPTTPVTADGDIGVLFLHNEGYSTMCGHGIIALVKVGLECGLLDAARLERDGIGNPIVRIDTPAGRVTARAHLADGATIRVERVSFRNVPSFVFARDVEVDMDDFGPIRCDVAFGGAFYAYVEAEDLGLRVDRACLGDLIEAGRRLKAAVSERCRIAHPHGDPDLDFLYGTIFTASGEGGIHSRNACVFADGEVDRSPTGTGVSGRAALLHARGELPVGRSITIASVIDTTFEVCVAETTRVGPLPAVVPEVTGEAHLTGRHEFYVDPDDPVREGFLLR